MQAVQVTLEAFTSPSLFRTEALLMSNISNVHPPAKEEDTSPVLDI